MTHLFYYNCTASSTLLLYFVDGGMWPHPIPVSNAEQGPGAHTQCLL